MDPALLHTAAAFLKQMRTASLATADADGRPHAANIQYASDKQCSLYFLSSDKSAHVQHLSANHHVALTIYHHDDRPHMIQGLQMRGRCERLTTPQHENHWPLYAEKFPIVNEPTMRAIALRQGMYRVTPNWLRWIDNRVEFGFRQEWSDED